MRARLGMRLALVTAMTAGLANAPASAGGGSSPPYFADSVLTYLGGADGGTHSYRGCPAGVAVGDGMKFKLSIRATDRDRGASVALVVKGLPRGATMKPRLPVRGLPAKSTLAWTPTTRERGMHRVTFIATDNTRRQARCSFQVKVYAETTLVADPVWAEVDTDPRITFPKLRATLTERATGRPVRGRFITFRLSGSDVFEFCSAQTDARGVAECGGLEDPVALLATRYLGYWAVFYGDRVYADNAAHGPLLRVFGKDVPY